MILKQELVKKFFKQGDVAVKEKERKGDTKQELMVLLTFVERTKEGHYSPIDKDSMSYGRIQAESESIEMYDEDYYYSIS